MAILGRLSKFNHTALLLLRLGIGAMMIFHGYPKLTGGPEKWARLGGAMSAFGLHDFPSFWGFMAAFAESVGGLIFILGYLFRPATLLLLITMIVAAAQHLRGGDGIMGSSHAIELAILFLAMFIIGPGRFSIDKT